LFIIFFLVDFFSATTFCFISFFLFFRNPFANLANCIINFFFFLLSMGDKTWAIFSSHRVDNIQTGAPVFSFFFFFLFLSF